MKKKTSSNRKSTAEIQNSRAQWAAFEQLQKRVDAAWDQLRSDIRRNANPRTLVRDRDALLLLLGECNYMARECMRALPQAQKSSRSRRM